VPFQHINYSNLYLWDYFKRSCACYVSTSIYLYREHDHYKIKKKIYKILYVLDGIFFNYYIILYTRKNDIRCALLYCYYYNIVASSSYTFANKNRNITTAEYHNQLQRRVFIIFTDAPKEIYDDSKKVLNAISIIGLI